MEKKIIRMIRYARLLVSQTWTRHIGLGLGLLFITLITSDEENGLDIKALMSVYAILIYIHSLAYASYDETSLDLRELCMMLPASRGEKFTARVIALTLCPLLTSAGSFIVADLVKTSTGLLGWQSLLAQVDAWKAIASAGFIIGAGMMWNSMMIGTRGGWQFIILFVTTIPLAACAYTWVWHQNHATSMYIAMSIACMAVAYMHSLRSQKSNWMYQYNKKIQ